MMKIFLIFTDFYFKNTLLPQMKIYKIFLFFFTFSLLSFVTHKYYVSLTQIYHNEKEKSVEITLQVFTDDLELCLNNQFNETLVIANSKDKLQTNQFIFEYLNQKLWLNINGKPLKYQMIGYETKDDLTFIYLEIKGIKALKSLDISNLLFFEVFEEQQHIVKIKTKGVHKNILLLKDKNQATINL